MCTSHNAESWITCGSFASRKLFLSKSDFDQLKPFKFSNNELVTKFSWLYQNTSWHFYKEQEKNFKVKCNFSTDSNYFKCQFSAAMQLYKKSPTFNWIQSDPKCWRATPAYTTSLKSPRSDHTCPQYAKWNWFSHFYCYTFLAL